MGMRKRHLTNDDLSVSYVDEYVLKMYYICHRLLHYSVDLEKEDILGRIYYDRADRLAVSGIRISKSDFMKLCM